MASPSVRIAVIGCGAISELYHLPALRANGALRDAVLIDADSRRLQEVAERFGVGHTSTDYRTVIEQIDGAIVATPPATHRDICVDLLKRRIPVLCEKPLAQTAADAERVVRAAASAGTALLVNQTRRLYPTNLKIRELLEEGALGELRSITYLDGSPFNWPTASGFYFEPGARGVIADRGIHSLDLLCWWLGSKPTLEACQTDSFGGPESVALMELSHHACNISLKLSWLTSLQNTFEIIGTEGQLRGHIGRWRYLSHVGANGRESRIKLAGEEAVYNEFGIAMVKDLLHVISSGVEPVVPGHSVIAAIELIDEAYRVASRMDLPWLYGEVAS